MLANKTLSVLATTLCLLGLACVAILFVTVRWADQAEGRLISAYSDQMVSTRLADELRQSSDDLTRLARTYAVTGDPAYEAQYMDILAIRNGEKERPENYHRIYWDFVAADMPHPGGSGVTRPLQDLMRDAGFTEEEFALLSEAQANSDGLVGLEVQAMNAVKGVFADEAGSYVRRGEPDFELARTLLHSPEYHQYKAQIMAPIDRFLERLEQRLSTRIEVAQHSYSDAMHAMWWATGAMIVIVLALATCVLGFVIRPMLRLARLIDQDTAETSPCSVPGINRRDEIGILARSIDRTMRNSREHAILRAQVLDVSSAAQAGVFSNRMSIPEGQMGRRISLSLNGLMDALESAFAELEARLQAIAAGDLTARPPVSAEGQFGHVMRHAEDARQSLRAIVEQARHGSAALSEQGIELNTLSDDVQRRIESNAAGLEQTTAAIHDVSQSIDRVADHAGVARAAALTARDNTLRVSEDFAQVVKAMTTIEESSDQIAQITDLIDNIAFQTNLLALNAGVEAARANQSGSGFAVVANEVRELARRTSDAAGSIGALIRTSGERIANGTQLARQVSGVVEQVTSEIQGIADRISELSDQTAQQATSMRGISQTLETLDGNIQSNASMVMQVSSTSGHLRNEAAALERTVAGFRLEAEQAQTHAHRAA